MKKLSVTALLLLLTLSLSTKGFGQAGTLGTLTGIVSDSGGAVLPGVTIRVVNDDTGVANSMLTNDNGVYRFLLSPGANYSVSAEFTGFKKSQVTKIPVRAADEQTVNVGMEIGDVTTEVTVSADRNPMMNELNQHIGTSLDQNQLQNLPMMSTDPIQLITTLPGYRASPLGHEYDTVGGLPMYMMNTVRDGLSVTDGMFPNGVSSGTQLNPDMIAEIRLILAPVDAEAGRGNGQVQITTKSGTNKFQWNINYNFRQNALNSLGPSPSRVRQPFGATFQYLLSAGGPIIKNRTFYFVNWDHQMRFQRSGGGTGGFNAGAGGYLAVPALTDLARNGVFRYFDGWASQPLTSITTTPLGGGVPNNTGTAVWTVDGNDPTIVPQYFPNATLTPYTGAMKCYSVFGTIKFDGTPFDPNTDCGTYIPRRDDGLGNGLLSWVPDYANPLMGVGIVPGGMDYQARVAAGMNPIYSWEIVNPDGTQVQRPPDRTGYIQRLISYMPRVNVNNSASVFGGQTTSGFGTLGNDALNRSSHEFVRGTKGLDNRNTFRGGTFGFGTGLDQNLVGHKIINVKVDHVIDSRSRITLGTSMQDDQNSRLNFQSRWPDGINGYSARVPRVLTLNGISTLSPNMVNEARFGINLNRSTQLPPWEVPDDGAAEFARTFLQTGWADANCTGPNPSKQCETFGGVTPVYFTPGSPGVAGQGYMNFADNILPGSSNQGFQNSGSAGIGFTQNSQCTGVAAINCEAMAKLVNFADTFSWNRGNHSIRAGAEIRLTRALEASGGNIPSATSGASTGSASLLENSSLLNGLPEMPGFDSTTGLGRNARVALTSAELLYLLSGSVQQVSQEWWANSMENFRDGTWDTWSTGDGRKNRTSIQNEYAIFVKDDWRIGRSLTLNLGVRYENYGNLYTRGFATGLLNEGLSLFGPAQDPNANPFDSWLRPGNTYYTGYGTTAPAINVTGQFLPNGQPSYIPGNCTPIAVGSGTCAAVPGSFFATGGAGGPSVQQLPGNISTTAVACVYGVNQVIPLNAIGVFLPTSTCDPSELTTRIFVGPGSDHPEQAPLYRDRNNIGPAIGFSWRAPFVGNRTLLVRGGFQFTFGSAGRDRTIASGTSGQLTQQNGGSLQTLSLDQGSSVCTNIQTCLGAPPDALPYALTLSDLPNLVPLVPPVGVPTVGGQFGNLAKENSTYVQNWGKQRTSSATGYAPGYQDPRTENYTFSVSTNLNRTSTLAISYVGTLGRNRPTGVNLNMPNVYHNPELLDALVRTRAGDDVELFDQMFAGYNLTGLASTAGYGNIGTCVTFAGGPGGGAGNCPAGTVYQSGSAHLRRASTTLTNVAANLANGNFAQVVAFMANANGLGAFANGGISSSHPNFFGVGSLVRNGCDRIATATLTDRRDLISGSATSGNTNPVRCFPEDYMIINPGSATGENGDAGPTQGMIWKDNWGYTNYHQLQFQYTLRTASGANIQATYLTSKTMALPRDFYKTNTFSANAGGGVAFGAVTGFSDPFNEETRQRDYGESSDSLKHAVRLNGVLPLPFGVGQPLLRNAPGFLQRIIGGWQLGVIYNGQSGAPFSILAGDMMYGKSSGGASAGCNAYSGSLGTGGSNCSSGMTFPDIESTLWTSPQGKMTRDPLTGNNTYFGNPSPFALIRDPQCNNNVGRSSVSDVGTFNLASSCTLQALVMKVAPGTPGSFPLSAVDPTPVLIMLKNPEPGKQGTLGGQTMRQPGRFSLDANLAKIFYYTERRGIQIRVDATNVLNKAQPADVYINLGPGGSFNDVSTAQLSAISSGCFSGNAFCGRQVQFGIRMINN